MLYITFKETLKLRTNNFVKSFFFQVEPMGKKKYVLMTSYKRVRICGHLVTFTRVNSCLKWKSDLNLIIFELSTYFGHIVQFLSLFENLKLTYLSKYHDQFYKSSNSTSKLFK